MNVNRVIEVRNHDPVGRLREFLAAWWQAADLDALLAPIELADRSGVMAQVIQEPSRLRVVNPFAPIMLSNAAPAVGKFSRDHPDGRAAVMLRPCELRALTELRKRRRAESANHVATIVGTDCLATLPQSEFLDQVRAEGLREMVHKALEEAAEGECSARQPRMACCLCTWPAPRGADVVIGAIGVSPEEYLLIIARDETTDERLSLAQVTDGLATEAQVVRREVAVGAIARKRSKACAEIVRSVPQRFSDVGSLLSWFAACSLCGDCLDACPLYDGELSGLLGVGGTRHGGQALLAELVDVSRWLASCSGCGMCQEACASGVPLTRLIAALTHRIQEELHYTPGDPNQMLPWAAPCG